MDICKHIYYTYLYNYATKTISKVLHNYFNQIIDDMVNQNQVCDIKMMISHTLSHRSGRF